MHSGTRFKGFFNLDELFFRTTVKKLISDFFFLRRTLWPGKLFGERFKSSILMGIAY